MKCKSTELTAAAAFRLKPEATLTLMEELEIGNVANAWLAALAGRLWLSCEMAAWLPASAGRRRLS